MEIWTTKNVASATFDAWLSVTSKAGCLRLRHSTLEMASCGLCWKTVAFWTHRNKNINVNFPASFNVTRRLNGMLTIYLFVYNRQLCLENDLW